MAETLVDLGYRGVTFAKRVKLVQVRPGSGFVELAAPMPVGTAIALADDALSIPAVVTRVREQVSGVAAPAGMQVAPTLDEDAARTWWQARVELPAEPEQTERMPRIAAAELARPPVVPAQPPAPRTTAPMPAVAAPADPPDDKDVAGSAVAAALVAAQRSSPATRPPPAQFIEDDHSKRTMVMDAVSASVLAELSASDSDSKLALADDGKRTEMMAAVDLKALGLDPASSGRLPGMTMHDARAATEVDAPEAVEDEGSEPHDAPADPDKPADRPSSPAKRKRKKR